MRICEEVPCIPLTRAKKSTQTFFVQSFLRTLRVMDRLSDPRNRNHKSLAIANRNFEVASFSRRNRNEIAVFQVFLESQ